MSDEIKHTPGPWSVLQRGQKNGPYIVATADGYYSDPFLSVVRGEPTGGYGWPAISHEEKLANARLIAAAPELLEAIESAPIISQYHRKSGFEYDRLMDDYYQWRRRTAAAIAKAKGLK